VFSFEGGNRCISPAIAIKSPAMNFSSMGSMLKNKSSCLFYFNCVSLSFAGMYSRSEQILVFELGYDLTLISCMKKCCCDKESSRWPIFGISITSGFYLTLSFSSEDKYAMNEGWRSEQLIISLLKHYDSQTVEMMNKSLIIPTEDWRPTSLGPNEHRKHNLDRAWYKMNH